MSQFILNLGPILALFGSGAILVGFSHLAGYLVHSFTHSHAWELEHSAHGARRKLADIHDAGERAIRSARLIGLGLIIQIAGFALMVIDALSNAPAI